LWHLQSNGREGLRLLRLASDRGGSEHSAVQARVLVARVLVATKTAPSIEAFEVAEPAAEMATEYGDAATARLARTLAAIARIGVDLDAARDQAVEVRADADAADDAFIVDASRVLVGLVHQLRDENDLAITALGDAARRLRDRGDRSLAITGLCTLAIASARLGHLDRAQSVAADAVAAADPLRDFHWIGWARSVLAEIHGLKGELDQAEAALEPLGYLVDDSRRPPFSPGWARAQALLALWRGRPHDAVDWCRREAVALVGEADDDAPTPETQLVLGVALAATGDDAAAVHRLDAVAESAAALKMPRIRAAALEARSRLLDTDDPVRAIGVHHEVLRVRSELGLVLECVDSLEVLAELELRRDAVETAAVLAGATARARSETGYAVASFGTGRQDELAARVADSPASDAFEKGRKMSVDEAVAYVSRSRGPRGRPDSGWESLTPTERSVVELAVAGRSNPQIAEQLFMSRGTVKAHLGRVYTKLGVANRTELARVFGSDPV
jgi:ATP/maltotriose-dependent transcriptional regulator MalT